MCVLIIKIPLLVEQITPRLSWEKEDSLFNMLSRTSEVTCVYVPKYTLLLFFHSFKVLCTC